MEDEELIRRDMERTRAVLTEKVETLERKLTDPLAEGVEAVKNAVDIQAQFESHPWLMLGGSLLGGYVVATMIGGASRKLEAGQPAPSIPDLSCGNGKPASPPEQTSEAKTDWLDKFAPEIDHLKRLALGVSLGTIREIIAAEAPPEMGVHLRAILDEVTKKTGGEVLPSSDWSSTRQPGGDIQESTNGAAGGIDPDQSRRWSI